MKEIKEYVKKHKPDFIGYGILLFLFLFTLLGYIGRGIKIEENKLLAEKQNITIEKSLLLFEQSKQKSKVYLYFLKELNSSVGDYLDEPNRRIVKTKRDKLIWMQTSKHIIDEFLNLTEIKEDTSYSLEPKGDYGKE